MLVRELSDPVVPPPEGAQKGEGPPEPLERGGQAAQALWEDLGGRCLYLSAVSARALAGCARACPSHRWWRVLAGLAAPATALLACAAQARQPPCHPTSCSCARAGLVVVRGVLWPAHHPVPHERQARGAPLPCCALHACTLASLAPAAPAAALRTSAGLRLRRQWHPRRRPPLLPPPTHHSPAATHRRSTGRSAWGCGRPLTGASTQPNTRASSPSSRGWVGGGLGARVAGSGARPGRNVPDPKTRIYEPARRCHTCRTATRAAATATETPTPKRARRGRPSRARRSCASCAAPMRSGTWW